MDREIDPRTLRRRRLTKAGSALAAAAVVVTLLAALLGWLRPSVSRARILTARAERGRIEAVIEASGTVLPARETAISSPIDTRVVRILKRPGDAVRAGEPLVELDTAAMRLEAERLEDRLAQVRNEQVQARLRLERSLDDLSGRIEKAVLDSEILRARHRRNLRLSEGGLVSEEALKESEVEARKAEIEVDLLRRSVESARKATGTELEGIALDLGILEKEAAEARHRLDLATARAGEDGVLTWIVPEEGASVRGGDVLARVARLDAFRVEATVSDVHVSRLAGGMPVRVAVDGGDLAGTIATVFPKIEAGVVRFAVDLREPSDPRLRQNLRVDVFVVAGERDDVVWVRRGPFLTGGAVQPIFVIEGNRAVRRSVGIGLVGRDNVEITQGLAPGEEVIVSEMTDHLHLAEVHLR